MKGAQMTVNVLIIVALAIVVLAAILWLFMTQFGAGSEAIDLKGEHSRLCGSFVLSRGCEPGGDTDNIEVEIDGQLRSLTQVCSDIGIIGKDACKESCGCPKE